MNSSIGEFAVVRTLAFDVLAKDYTREHPNLEADLLWLIGRVAEAPENGRNQEIAAQ